VGARDGAGFWTLMGMVRHALKIGGVTVIKKGRKEIKINRRCVVHGF
jgi:hypothetical protein